VVKFLPGRDADETLVDMVLSYEPVAGRVGHVLAWLLGGDPKRRLETELTRLKRYVETGVAPHDAARRARRPRI